MHAVQSYWNDTGFARLAGDGIMCDGAFFSIPGTDEMHIRIARSPLLVQ